MENTASRASGQTTGPKAPVHPAPLALVSVPFRGGFVEAAQLDGEVWVPIRPVCDALGLAVQRQLAKLKAKPWATVTFIVSVAADGKARQLAAVDLRSLPLWLATIEPSRVKPEARPALPGAPDPGEPSAGGVGGEGRSAPGKQGGDGNSRKAPFPTHRTGRYHLLMQHVVPRSRLLIECAKAGVDPRTVRKMLAGKPVRPLASERAARVIARLHLTPGMSV